MKNIRAFIAGCIVTAALVVGIEHVSAGVASFKTDFIAAVTNNFTAGDRTRIGNGFVAAYQTEWNARLASGTVDNAANRGIFVADKVGDYMKAVVLSTEQTTAVQAVPTPTPLTP